MDYEISRFYMIIMLIGDDWIVKILGLNFAIKVNEPFEYERKKKRFQ